MLRRLLARLRLRRELTPEDVAAQAEAKKVRDDVETLRTGDLTGPPMFTHGGKESRGR